MSSFLCFNSILTSPNPDVILLRVLHHEKRSEIMRVTSKGQVTIPRSVRQRLGIFPQSEVEFVIEGNTVILRTVTGEASQGKLLIETLRERATIKMTTDEIMALTRGEE
jgi:AbrB family looped-hinge helix DNA binding protein